MKIKEKLEILRSYYNSNRRVGHTNLMRKGTDNVDNKLVLVYKKLGSVYGCKESDQISWHKIKGLIGQDKPLVIDNGVMWCLLNEAIDEIEELEISNKKLNQIKQII